MIVCVKRIDEIHLGERLKALINGASHGRGLTGFAKFLDKSTGSVHHMYKVDDLDFKIVVKACEYYGVTLAGFLGMNDVELPEGISFSAHSPEPGELRMDRMESKLDEILKLLNTK